MSFIEIAVNTVPWSVQAVFFVNTAVAGRRRELATVANEIIRRTRPACRDSRTGIDGGNLLE